MAIDDHPLTVFNRQIENDELADPVGTGAIKGAAKVVGAISHVPVLMPLGFIAKGLDLTGKCLSIGVPTVEENLKLFAKLTEEAILRHEERLIFLEAVPKEAEKFQRRAESKEFLQLLASGVLQTQRTTQENRLRRMAWIIANGVSEGDLDPESGDDMMRVAVELKDADITLLGKIFVSQRSLLQQQRGRDTTYWFGELQGVWDEFVKSGALDARNHLVYRSSFSRLESRGLIQKFREISTAGVGLEPYVLLEEGLKFYERLQEISDESGGQK